MDVELTTKVPRSDCEEETQAVSDERRTKKEKRRLSAFCFSKNQKRIARNVGLAGIGLLGCLASISGAVIGRGGGAVGQVSECRGDRLASWKKMLREVR
jgi:hypothetical protein